jgi:hypothetical protein
MRAVGMTVTLVGARVGSLPGKQLWSRALLAVLLLVACDKSTNPNNPNEHPAASIQSPDPNAAFESGQSVPFQGTGTDQEDGALSGAALVWASSRDGQLGTGTSISNSTLTVGTHTITLTVTDSKGATGAASRTIFISAGTGRSGDVRVLYLIPQDRAFRSDYSLAVQNAMDNVESWYRDQLAGKTFSLFGPQPETCRLPQTADYYATGSWSKLMNDVQSCAPVSYNLDFVWMLYVDIIHACNDPDRLGAGRLGVAMMPRQDMDGLIGVPVVLDECGAPIQIRPISRWIGGAGHELGHALGLPHPPGCEQNLPSCDFNALMWAGYDQYPTTYLRSDDKQLLCKSPFIKWTAARPPRLFAASIGGTLLGSVPPSDLYSVEASQAGTDCLIDRIRTTAGFEPAVTDLALAPNGQLWAISFDRLYLIDTLTAIATDRGALGLSDVNALAADARGALYATTLSGSLLSIDPASGTARTIGPLGNGFVSWGDLAFAPDGRLFAALRSATGQAVLITINTSTGQATLVSPGMVIGNDNVWGLAFAGDQLFGLTTDIIGRGTLLDINPTSGQGTYLRALSFNAGGGAAVRQGEATP